VRCNFPYGVRANTYVECGVISMLLFVVHGIVGDDDDDNDESCCSEGKYGTGQRKLLMDSWKLACVCKLCRIHWFTSQTDLIRSHTSSQYRLEMTAIFGGGWETDGLILQISVNVFVYVFVCKEYIEFCSHTA
jgi:hypothetical protein